MMVPVKNNKMDTWIWAPGEMPMREVPPFKAVLLFSHTRRGRSAIVCYFQVKGAPEGIPKEVPVSFTVMEKLIPQMEGGMTELLTWVPYKQGTSYFVKPEGM